MVNSKDLSLEATYHVTQMLQGMQYMDCLLAIVVKKNPKVA